MAVLGSTSLTGCNSIPDFILGGSLMLFQQTAAPPGWTKQTTHNNKALRVVSGSATPGGGPLTFTQVFTSRTPSGTVNQHTLSAPQLASHNHPGGVSFPGARVNPLPTTPTPTYTPPGLFGVVPSQTGNNSPANNGHDHPFTGDAQDFAVAYVDLIICAKN